MRQVRVSDAAFRGSPRYIEAMTERGFALFDTAIAAADPFVLGGGEGAVHLTELLSRGAKGIKVHPVLQGFFPNDPRMDAIYDLCEEEHLTVLSHSGSTKGSPQWADPFAFADEDPRTKGRRPCWNRSRRRCVPSRA